MPSWTWHTVCARVSGGSRSAMDAYLFLHGVGQVSKVCRARLHGVESADVPSETWETLDERELHEEGVILGVQLEPVVRVHHGPLLVRREPDLYATPRLQIFVEWREAAKLQLVVVVEADDVMHGGLAVLQVP